MSGLPPTFVPGFHDEKEVKKMKYHKFGDTDMFVSHLSLGTGTFCNQYGEFTLEECKETLLKALKSGINYIDTAPWYGHGVSEEVLGKCLKGIPRKAYYIATKTCRYEKDPKLMFDFTAKKTRESIDTSLKRLGLDYVDVIQAHDIEFAPSLDMVIKETLPVLEEAVKAGKAKYIGVTGYPVSTLKDCIKQSKVKIDCVLSYTRLTLIDNTLKEYLPYFESKKLGIINAASNCMRLLTNCEPPDWHPATQEIRDVCSEAKDYCKERGVELGRLAVHYSFNQPGPHTHLVGINTREILDRNLNVLYNGLSELERDTLKHLQEKVFTKLEKVHWEGVEIANLKKILKNS